MKIQIAKTYYANTTLGFAYITESGRRGATLVGGSTRAAAKRRLVIALGRAFGEKVEIVTAYVGDSRLDAQGLDKPEASTKTTTTTTTRTTSNARAGESITVRWERLGDIPEQVWTEFDCIRGSLRRDPELAWAYTLAPVLGAIKSISYQHKRKGRISKRQRQLAKKIAARYRAWIDDERRDVIDAWAAIDTENFKADRYLSGCARYGAPRDEDIDGLVEHAERRLDEMQDEPAPAPKVDAPEGRHDVTFRVDWIGERDSYYGTTMKMRATVVTPEGEWAFWGTATKLEGVYPEVGDILTCRFTFDPSDDDAAFAFAKRPHGLRRPTDEEMAS